MKHSGKNKLNLKLPAMDSSGQANHENSDRQLYSTSTSGNVTSAATAAVAVAQSSPHATSTAIPSVTPQPQNRHR